MPNDLGDFQTPLLLVDRILDCPELSGKTWSRVLEPTCGQGNFIRALYGRVNPPAEIQAIEIQDRYVRQARAISSAITVHQNSVFDLHLGTDLHWKSSGPLLVLGNPPWITNAELGISESRNLPEKSNLKRLSGFDAMTGSSNFDISEYILLKLIWELADAQPTIAMLCKTTVARNILQFAPSLNLPITFSALRKIDAKKWFNAAVDACLFYFEIKPGYYNPKTAVYPDLQSIEPTQIMEHKHGQLIPDSTTYDISAFIEGQSTLTWRQGVKHDAASIMELGRHPSGSWQNKAGQLVTVEPQYIYPLLKSSDLSHEPMGEPGKAVIITQQRLTDNTHELETAAPLLWKYLNAHEAVFAKRKSSIYANKPPFSIFGIGDYAFAPYKVAVAGMSRTPRFHAISPIGSHPVMCDDTCYFIACRSAEQAALVATLLNSTICVDFIKSIMFKESKRPITKKLLQRINLQKLLVHITPEKALLSASAILTHLKTAEFQSNTSWPASLETLLFETSMPQNAQFSQVTFDLWSSTIL